MKSRNQSLSAVRGLSFGVFAASLGLVSAACSSGGYDAIDEAGAGSDVSEAIEVTLDGSATESVAGITQAIDSACVNACMRGCVCDDFKPAACRRQCLVECRAECACTASCAGKACGAPDGCGGVCSKGTCPSGQTCGGGGVLNQCGCTASCAGKACGASDGCGGQCNAGSCPGGAVCGGGGVPGLCGLPNLIPSVTGSFQIVGFNSKQGTFEVTIRNLGPVDATNVEVLLQSNSPAGLLDLQPNGFSCYLPNGYYPRLGLMCVGGSIPRFSTTTIRVVTALSVSGYNVLSAIADPNNAIIELSESDNLANAGVNVP